MRGLSTSVDIGGGQNGVSLYIDDMQLSTGDVQLALDMRLFDVKRVEVLKGPQGTLFGSGSLSGAIRILTNKPDASGFDAAASVDFSSTDGDSFGQRFNGMLNIPLIEDELALRLVGYYRDEEGYVDNIGTGIENSDSNVTKGARLSVRWTPTDRLAVTFSSLFEDSDQNDVSLFDPTVGKHTSDTFIPMGIPSKLLFHNLALEYEFDWATLTSATNLISTHDHYLALDVSPAIGSLVPFGIDELREKPGWAQELRLVSSTDTAWKWVVGGYFADRDMVNNGVRLTTPESLAEKGITGLRNGNQFTGYSTSFDDRELAVFGEISYELADDLILTGGLRRATYESEQRNALPGSWDSDFFGLLLGGGTGDLSFSTPTPTSLKLNKTSKVTKKISLSWLRNEDQTFYITAAEGYRNALPNPRGGEASATDPNDPLIIPFVADPDTAWNYELGAKTQWFDRTVTANLALYHVDWEGMRLQASRVSDGAQLATNAGDSISQGMELEIRALPSPEWELGLALTVQNTEVDNISAVDADISGMAPGQSLIAPDFKISGSAERRWYMDRGQLLYVRVDAQHRSSFPNGPKFDAGLPGVIGVASQDVPSSEHVNVHVGWESSQWSVVLYGTNILDNDDYTYVGSDPVLKNRLATSRPRTWGVRVGMTR